MTGAKQGRSAGPVEAAGPAATGRGMARVGSPAPRPARISLRACSRLGSRLRAKREADLTLHKGMPRRADTKRASSKPPYIPAVQRCNRSSAGGSRFTARRSRSTTRGFSLLEMIVATAILGIAIIGLMTLITTVLANAARIREYDRAAMLARTKMNQLLVEEPLPLGIDLSGKFETGLGWEARVEPFFMPPTPRPGRTMLVRIKLGVWWDSDGRRKRLQLESFRRMIIHPEHGLG